MTFDPHQPDQLERYGRQLQLRQIGPAGQARLGNARAVVVGAGGLGCPAAIYLVAAGLGAVHMVDGDRVDLSNLNRQTLYTATDVGRFKAEVAAERLERTTAATERITRTNAARVLQGADVVLDASDNFETRFLLADACRILGKPLVQAAVTQFAGQLATYMPEARPCYRCFFPEPPPDGTIAGCSEAGILGAAAGVMGSLQALEAIKLVAGAPPTTGRLLVLDLWTLSMDNITLPAHPDCPLCGPDAWITAMADAGTLEAR